MIRIEAQLQVAAHEVAVPRRPPFGVGERTFQELLCVARRRVDGKFEGLLLCKTAGEKQAGRERLAGLLESIGRACPPLRDVLAAGRVIQGARPGCPPRSAGGGAACQVRARISVVPASPETASCPSGWQEVYVEDVTRPGALCTESVPRSPFRRSCRERLWRQALRPSGSRTRRPPHSRRSSPGPPSRRSTPLPPAGVRGTGRNPRDSWRDRASLPGGRSRRAHGRRRRTSPAGRRLRPRCCATPGCARTA